MIEPGRVGEYDLVPSNAEPDTVPSPVWLLWDGGDYYGPDLVDVFATEEAALAEREAMIRRDYDRRIEHDSTPSMRRILSAEDRQRRLDGAKRNMDDALAADPYGDMGRLYVERREPLTEPRSTEEPRGQDRG